MEHKRTWQNTRLADTTNELFSITADLDDDDKRTICNCKLELSGCVNGAVSVS